jgi:hypothetical protein
MENQNQEFVPQPQESEAMLRRKREQKMEELLARQNMPFAIGAGIAAGLVGAILWAVITVAIKYQIGYMAIGVGFLVGYAMKYAGNGLTITYGIIGAVIAIASCFLGNYLSLIGLYGVESSLGFFEAWKILPFSLVIEAMKENLNPIDFLFYGIAGFEGFKFSFTPIDDAMQNS